MTWRCLQPRQLIPRTVPPLGLFWNSSRVLCGFSPYFTGLTRLSVLTIVLVASLWICSHLNPVFQGKAVSVVHCAPSRCFPSVLPHVTRIPLSTMNTWLMEAAHAIAGCDLEHWCSTFMLGLNAALRSFPSMVVIYSIAFTPSFQKKEKKNCLRKQTNMKRFVHDLLFYMPILLAFWRGGVRSWTFTSSLNVMIFVAFVPVFRMRTSLSNCCQFWGKLWYPVISLPSTQHRGCLSFFLLIFVKLKNLLLFCSSQV